jgi:hypothetical protein
MNLTMTIVFVYRGTASIIPYSGCRNAAFLAVQDAGSVPTALCMTLTLIQASLHVAIADAGNPWQITWDVRGSLGLILSMD